MIEVGLEKSRIFPSEREILRERVVREFSSDVVSSMLRWQGMPGKMGVGHHWTNSYTSKKVGERKVATNWNFRIMYIGQNKRLK